MYPEVQAQHLARLRAIKKLSVEEHMFTGPKLQVTVDSCRELRQGSGFDRLPDAFVKVEVVEMEFDGYKQRAMGAIYKVKTKRKKNSVQPSWRQKFTTCRLPLQRSRLRLEVVDWNPASTDSFLGQVELDLWEATLPHNGVDMPLQPQLDQKGKVKGAVPSGTISFSVKQKKEHLAFKVMSRLSNMMSRAAEEEEDPHAALCATMKKKARFIVDAVHRLQRVKHYIERMPMWKQRVAVRQHAVGRWARASDKVRAKVMLKKRAQVVPVTPQAAMPREAKVKGSTKEDRSAVLIQGQVRKQQATAKVQHVREEQSAVKIQGQVRKKQAMAQVQHVREGKLATEGGSLQTATSAWTENTASAGRGHGRDEGHHKAGRGRGRGRGRGDSKNQASPGMQPRCKTFIWASQHTCTLSCLVSLASTSTTSPKMKLVSISPRRA